MVGAFKAQTSGAQTVDVLKANGPRIRTVPGKRGLNACSTPELDVLGERQCITDVVFAGAVTSIGIDSTGRAARELGYQVNVLSDCTAGRTNDEQAFYCEYIFPSYA
ncbi:MAG: isochorismatase family protein [Myxococcota bacterium]|nr:isochorismatase family protein [Myxococcota bacterium]